MFTLWSSALCLFTLTTSPFRHWSIFWWSSFFAPRFLALLTLTTSTLCYWSVFWSSSYQQVSTKYPESLEARKLLPAAGFGPAAFPPIKKLVQSHFKHQFAIEKMITLCWSSTLSSGYQKNTLANRSFFTTLSWKDFEVLTTCTFFSSAFWSSAL